MQIFLELKNAMQIFLELKKEINFSVLQVMPVSFASKDSR